MAMAVIYLLIDKSGGSGHSTILRAFETMAKAQDFVFNAQLIEYEIKVMMVH